MTKDFIMNEMKDLIEYLNYHTSLYNIGKPIISDMRWDQVYFKLLNLEKESGIVLPNSPTQTIKAPMPIVLCYH